MRERMELLLASFSRKAVPEGRRLVTQTFTPDIYVAELKKKGLKVPGGSDRVAHQGIEEGKVEKQAEAEIRFARRRAPARKR